VLVHAKDSNSVTVEEKKAALNEAGVPEGHARKQLMARLTTWLKPENRRRYRAAAGGATRVAIASVGKLGSEAAWPVMEEELDKRRREKNDKGLRVTRMWVSCTARRLCRALYPNNEKARAFRASPGWFARYTGRFQVVPRKVSNMKKWSVRARSPCGVSTIARALIPPLCRSIREVIPLIWLWLRWLRYHVLPARDASGGPITPGHPDFDALSPMEKKWGRFLPWCVAV
jgi:hypothetical protein